MLIIFEMANNHNGSLEEGKAIVDYLSDIKKNYHFDFAIKLQLRELDTFIHPNFVDYTSNKHIKRFLDTRLSEKDFYELTEYIKNKEFKLIITPFDEWSVVKCIDLDVDYIKIASCSAQDWSLLEYVSLYNKPIIISTAGLNFDEIDNVCSFFDHKLKKYSLLYCTAIYPTKLFQNDLNVIDSMYKRYKCKIGYSSHDDPNSHLQSVIATAKGAKIIERHVGLNKLNNYTLNKNQVVDWLDSILETEVACGNNYKTFLDDEKKSLDTLKRGVYANENIYPGEQIFKDKVFFAMPKIGIDSGQLSSYRKKFTATKMYYENDYIDEQEESNPKIEKLRLYTHRAKGLLAEAGIDIGESANKIEFSHHYGIDKFEEYGAIIFSVINREYCKKIIVMFKDQKYPTHCHHRKEETFQVLYGSLKIKIGDTEHNLKVGDSILVERYTMHDFTTSDYVIFEEISTTHIMGDSIYKDTSIYNFDPIERKTMVEKI